MEAGGQAAGGGGRPGGTEHDDGRVLAGSRFPLFSIRRDQVELVR